MEATQHETHLLPHEHLVVPEHLVGEPDEVARDVVIVVERLVGEGESPQHVADVRLLNLRAAQEHARS